MNKKTISWIITIIIVIAALVGLGVYTYNKLSKMQNQTPVPKPVTTTKSVTYFCTEGPLKALYTITENATGTVMLTLKDASTITMPQTISGSGIRYESGTNVFVSKGDNAFLTQNGTDTYTNCISGTITTSEATTTSTFIDTSETFSFIFPNEFLLSGGELGYTVNWAQQSTSTGLILAEITIPKEFMPKTNFGDAKFTIGTSSDPDAITNCLKYTLENKIATTTIIINNQEFTKINFSDVGAGNFYETTSYRTIHDNQCYAIEYTIHSSNIGNYSPDQGIVEFDKTKITEILENIVQSFKFL